MRLFAVGLALLCGTIIVYAVLAYICTNLPLLFSLYPESCKKATRFLVNPFDAKAWYWACVLLPRGVFLCVAAPIASEASHGQVCVTILINAVYFCMLAITKPWKVPA